MSVEERLQGLEKQLLAVEQLVLSLRLSVSELRTVLVAKSEASSSAAAAAPGPAVESGSQTVVRPVELSGPEAPHKGGKVYAVWKAGAGYPIGLYLTYPAYAEAVRDHNVPWNGRTRLPIEAGTESDSFGSLAAARDAWHQRFGGWPQGAY